MSGRVKDLTGQQFGYLTAESIAYVGKGKRKNAFWLCKCVCGGTKVINSSSLVEGGTKSCGCLRFKSASKSPCWGGFGEISGNVWCKIRDSAKKRKLEFDLSIEDAWNIFLRQRRLCALTHLPITFAKSQIDHIRGGCSASLDRIDSTKGYVKNNVQWVHKDVNRMKSNFSEEKFVELCRLIVKYS